LGIAVGTVRSRLHRARCLLTEKLREFRKPAGRLAVANEAKAARSKG
jgi:hypothetical protein